MLKQRVFTALVLVALTAWALFLSSDMVWKVSLLVVAGIAAWEWAGFSKDMELPVLKLIYALAVVTTANFAIDALSLQNIVLFTFLEVIMLVSVVHRYQFTKGSVGSKSQVFVMLSGAVFITLFVVVMVRFRQDFGATLLLLSMALIWAIDTGAYFTGRRFGKTKLAVFVSPGKTWEGVFGGVLLSFVCAIILLYTLSFELKISGLLFALILSVIAAFSVYGDLFESVLKRQAGVKDSGKILPGHGGVLDRVDSLLIAMPMLYLAWYFVQL